MIWLYEKASPFNNKLNNIIEMLSLLNLQVLFIFSYFTTVNDILINILVSLEMFLLLCIILMHLKVATCESYTINFNITNVIKQYFAMLKQQSSEIDQR